MISLIVMVKTLAIYNNQSHHNYVTFYLNLGHYEIREWMYLEYLFYFKVIELVSLRLKRQFQ